MVWVSEGHIGPFTHLASSVLYPMVLGGLFGVLVGPDRGAPRNLERHRSLAELVSGSRGCESRANPHPHSRLLHDIGKPPWLTLEVLMSLCVYLLPGGPRVTSWGARLQCQKLQLSSCSFWSEKAAAPSFSFLSLEISLSPPEIDPWNFLY